MKWLLVFVVQGMGAPGNSIPAIISQPYWTVEGCMQAGEQLKKSFEDRWTKARFSCVRGPN